MRPILLLVGAATGYTGFGLPWLRQQQQPLTVSQGKSTQSYNGRFTRVESFGFDIDLRDYYDHLIVTEDVDASLFPAGLDGAVRMVPGERGQPHNFLVVVRTIASSEAALSKIIVTNQTKGVFVSSRESLTTAPGQTGDHATLEIVIFIRPWSMQFGTTSITSSTLDIWISDDVFYETYHLNLKSRSATIWGTDALRFVPHTYTVTTGGNGSIIDRWPLTSSATFSTEHGMIDLFVTPKRWSAGPDTRGDLVARSAHSNISIVMDYHPENLSLRNATTVLDAPEGSIYATLVHGAVTTAKARDDVALMLLPYWAFSEWRGVQHNFISTVSVRGNTWVKVLSPVVDSYYKTNPLWFARSLHQQGKEGKGMELIYPGEWAGSAEGRGRNVDITGEEFERIAGNETVVRAKRRPVGSELVFEGEGADAVLELEACQTPRNEYCGWEASESEEL